MVGSDFGGRLRIALLQRCQDDVVVVVVMDDAGYRPDGSDKAVGEVHDTLDEDGIERIAAGAADKAVEVAEQGVLFLRLRDVDIGFDQLTHLLQVRVRGVDGGQTADFGFDHQARLGQMVDLDAPVEDQVGEIIDKGQLNDVAHKSTAFRAAPDLDESAGLQVAQGFAHYGPADAELVGQGGFAGQDSADFIYPGEDRPSDLLNDIFV